MRIPRDLARVGITALVSASLTTKYTVASTSGAQGSGTSTRRRTGSGDRSASGHAIVD